MDSLHVGLLQTETTGKNPEMFLVLKCSVIFITRMETRSEGSGNPVKTTDVLMATEPISHNTVNLKLRG